MKYLVISDIHGSFNSASRIKELTETYHCEMILCLGDILYHGPRNDLPETYAPKKVIPLMNELKNKIIAVRGNCEAEVDQMVLEFACMSDYNIIPFKENKLFMSHGHVYGPQHLPELTENDIFLSGHTHIPTAKKKDGIYLLNPGSMTLPKDGHPRTFAILDETSFTIMTLDHQEYMKIEL